MRSTIALCCVPHVIFADVPDVICAGNGESWTLTLQGDTASFAYLDRASDMQIMQRSVAEGADWPIAMTAIGPRDSAIVILEAATDGTHPVRVLTQRGEAPILLAGHCQPVPQ